MSAIAITDVAAFLYREARLLDDEAWDDWLECYHPDAQFWMPSWDDDGQLVGDPQREISLIYYPTRQGLEDRVFRIKTERSSATMPDTRTSHNIANVSTEGFNRRDPYLCRRTRWRSRSCGRPSQGRGYERSMERFTRCMRRRARRDPR